MYAVYLLNNFTRCCREHVVQLAEEKVELIKAEIVVVFSPIAVPSVMLTCLGQKAAAIR